MEWLAGPYKTQDLSHSRYLSHGTCNVVHSLRRVPVTGGVRVEMSWPNPLAGGLTEEYVVSEDGAGLAVTSSIRIGDKSAEATMVGTSDPLVWRTGAADAGRAVAVTR